jgi:beta-lactamase class A
MTRLSRRHALLAGLTLAAATACAPKPVLADPADPVPPIHLRIEAMQRRHNAKTGVSGST